MHIGSKSSYQSLYVSERYEKRFLLIIGDNFSDHDWDEDQRHQPLLSLSWALQCSAWQGFWCSRTNGDGNGGDDHCSWWCWWRNKEVWFSFVLFSVLAALTRWVIAVETNWPKLGTGSQSKVAKITKSQNHNDHFLRQPDLTGQCIISSLQGALIATANKCNTMINVTQPAHFGHSLPLGSIPLSAGNHFLCLM